MSTRTLKCHKLINGWTLRCIKRRSELNCSLKMFHWSQKKSTMSVKLGQCKGIFFCSLKVGKICAYFAVLHLQTRNFEFLLNFLRSDPKSFQFISRSNGIPDSFAVDVGDFFHGFLYVIKFVNYFTKLFCEFQTCDLDE